jgi:hypothetical protein
VFDLPDIAWEEFEKVELVPKRIQEWEDEDLMAGTAAHGLEWADSDQGKEMLNEMTLELPVEILQTELVSYNRSLQTPLKLDIPPQGDLNYFLIGVPLSFVLTDKIRMVRLNLELDLMPKKEVVAYDIYPDNEVQVKEILSGDFSVDIAKALTFVTKAPVGDVLNLKLEKPFNWKSQSIRIQCSGKLGNIVRWYVVAESMQNGFTGYVILKAPKGDEPRIKAIMAVELRKAGMFGHVLKTSYGPPKAKTYYIKAM